MPETIYVAYGGRVLDTPVYVALGNKDDAKNPDSYIEYTRDLFPSAEIEKVRYYLERIKHNDQSEGDYTELWATNALKILDKISKGG